VLTRHLNKRSDTTAIQAGGGSIGIIGAARTGLLLVRDPEDKDSRILVGTKSNLARLPRAMRLRLVEHPVLKVPRIEWLDQVDRDPDQLLEALRRPKGRSKLDDAIVLIAELLSKGPRPSVEVTERAREAGFSERTTERARKKLGVRSERPSGGPPDAGWQCRLPSEQGQQDLAAFDLSAPPDEV
jgi:hypothetical protein